MLTLVKDELKFDSHSLGMIPLIKGWKIFRIVDKAEGDGPVLTSIISGVDELCPSD